jgi:hypothetical protein
MAAPYFIAAEKCSKFKGGARELLMHLAWRCSPGGRAKNGHALLPEGWLQTSQETLMLLLNTKRRMSLYRWTQELVDGGVLNVKPTGKRHIYILNLEALKALALPATAFKKKRKPKPRPAGERAHSGVQDVSFSERKPLHHDVSVIATSDGGPCSENRSLLKPKGLKLNPKLQDDDAHTHPTGEERESSHHLASSSFSNQHRPVTEAKENSPEIVCPVEIKWAVNLETEWKSINSKPCDAEHLFQLIARGYSIETIYDVIHALPHLSHWNQIVTDSGMFLFQFKNILKSHEKYEAKIDQTATHANAADWKARCEQIAVSGVTEAIIEEQVEQFLSTVHRRAKLPPDPDDAAEEEAWLAADQAIEDGDAVELDPMQDPFEAEREDVEREDEMFDPFSTTSDGERRVGA